LQNFKKSLIDDDDETMKNFLAWDFIIILLFETNVIP
jgi:hypothetical protein